MLKSILHINQSINVYFLILAENKEAVLQTNAQTCLKNLKLLPNERISQQAKRALRNLGLD